MSDIPLLELKNIRRFYKDSDRALKVLDGANLTIKRGEMVGFLAPSGTGKTTLLNIAGLLEQPNSGDIYILGRPCSSFSDEERTLIRRDIIGFIYQFHHLLPEFTAIENITMPQLIAGRKNSQAINRAMQILSSLGLEDRADHYPSQLSGGEQQRVAIGRAVANMPLLLLADEPTGNLDPATSNQVFDLLHSLLKQLGLSALIATHNYELASRMDRLITLKNGKIVDVVLG